MKTILNVTGMSCQHCVRAVKEALEGMDGVNTVDVSLEANTATVEHDSAVTVDAMIAAVVEEGYEAVVK